MKVIYTLPAITAFLFMLVLLPIRTQAALPLSDVPLFLTTAVDPNVIFTLDDSGSMQWEIMPDGLIVSSARYVFPRASGIYGGSDYENRVVGFDADNWRSASLRSSDINRIYYNPAVRYLPWSNSDGSLMADASPTCAPHNPFNLAKGCRDLTQDTTQNARWLTVSGGITGFEDRTFYPAVYFRYNGGATNSASSYTRVEIRPGNTYDGSLDRTDCVAAPVCTYTEEIQNFANWYTYYRSRILLARAGVGRAFTLQGNNMRVGFGAINKGSTTIDGVSTSTLITGVRQFAGTNRDNFFNQLYGHTIPAAGTPLRKSMQSVGEYLKRTDDRGPWSTTPGEAGGTQPVCRQNYHILMTDGTWNGPDPSGIGNSDNTAGSVQVNHFPNAAPASYQYSPAPPYMDNYSNTLADVAMHYWKNDLRPDLANKVSTNAKDPAFWQHMVNFTVGLGVSGSLSELPATASGWPDPATDSLAKIDDLWHAAVNSRGEFFSAQEPVAFASGLSNVLVNITARTSSAAAVTTNTSRLNTGAQIYQAKFNSADWSGQLFAFNLQPDGSLGAMQWEASNQLPGHTSRKIFTHNGSTGLAFTASNFSSLSTTQQAALNKNIMGVDDGKGVLRLNWLRGDKSSEMAMGGTFRNRHSGLLGDIVNSDLLYVKAFNFNYEALPSGAPGKESYQSYVNTNKNRLPVVYAGANDGMLHALNAETGEELFAYVPAAVYPNLSKLTSADYTHRYFVDGNAYAGDAYIDSSWKTILLGSLGGGGKSIFALDISDPANFSASDILWEFADPDLGFVHGQAKIARLNNGSWAAVISNGYNSGSDKAYLFIVDLKTGALIKKIATNNSINNGLSSPALVDTNNDKIIDTVYAGDLLGNIWKFDLSHSNISQWGVAYKAGSNNMPLFTARNASNQIQPITSPLEIGFHKSGGYMVFFGTGQFIASGDNTNIQVQSLYGIWDNGSRITATDRSVLQQQTIVTETLLPPFERTVSSHPVDWTNKRGWYIDLQQPPAPGIAQGERSVVMPLLNFGRIIFTTLIPSDDPCEAGGRNWLMLVDAETGGMRSGAEFDTNDDGKVNNQDRVIAGINSDGIRSESVIISAGSLIHLVASTTTGAVENITIKNDAPSPRRSWKQIQ